jgi:hypothetical protein
MANHSQNLLELRQKFNEAINHDVYGRDSNNTLATLIQILNEAERMTQQCLTQAENLRRQAKEAEGKAEAFKIIPSIIQSVVGGYINLAKKDAEELAETRRQEAEDAEEVEEAIERVTEEKHSVEKPSVEDIKKKRKKKG